MGCTMAKKVFMARGMCVLLMVMMVTHAANGDKSAMIAFAFCLRECLMEMSVTYSCISC
jgi:hypothetical protein